MCDTESLDGNWRILHAWLTHVKLEKMLVHFTVLCTHISKNFVPIIKIVIKSIVSFVLCIESDVTF